MACSLASCTLPGATCSNFERVTSGYRASCGPSAARQPARLQQPGSWRVAAAASSMTAVLRTRSMQQRPARRRGALGSRPPMAAVATMPDPTVPETEKERSPLDYPQEWITPQPSRRPDIFPEFEKQVTPMPKPMPGDPELPDEEEEDEKKKDPEKDPDNPDKDPEKPAPDSPDE